MEDHKRKGDSATATEHKKTKKEQVHTKDAMINNDAMLQNNDGSQLLLKLIHTKAMSIKTRDEIIFSAQRDDNLCKVFKGLSDKRFMSVPVFLTTDLLINLFVYKQKDKKKWISFLGLFDIVKYVNEHFGKEKMSLEHDFWKMTNESEAFQKLKVNDVMSFPTRENKFHPITQDYSLFSVVEIMARDPHAHHIAILDDMKNRHLVSILTQSQLIKFVYEHLSLLGAKKDLLIKNMRGLCSEADVVSVPMTMLTIDAFKVMEDHNVTGLAVLSESGQLVDTLSIRDLKGMATDGSLFWKLYRPVSEFLEFLKKDAKTLRPRHAIFCIKDETFESALTKIYTNQVHRIFVVDSSESRKPISVISLGDLLLQLLPF
ncbi:cystathionine-beta-synthase domain-containing protein [Heterostelium album PN500]|uniref:Cystathionine-beta-synthase domain-containing protein n=1 Tax=Heterostelium pallidum (strain ATCC 26659 / Pp 5 / PN500) TaxID=670386 RepID=D3B1J1_HETP5|nr:cystathionine-beta-synthase domain-containing protein [Heterostelium album PN500]EFA85165.1 cystathionine-beta-synthase domain-containing protein [Heterostelium album PN500]|eukprot:XP_020437274.1 cystathionine-beta-synthase domain-containing protein [Heterostelium album PN500]